MYRAGLIHRHFVFLFFERIGMDSECQRTVVRGVGVGVVVEVGHSAAPSARGLVLL